PGAIAHWALTTAYLFPFSLGLAIVPGAIFGLALMLTRSRTQLERAVGVLTVACTTLFLAHAALISAGDAHRPPERYLFYLTPLVLLAFFAYVQRAAPRRVPYAPAPFAAP